MRSVLLAGLVAACPVVLPESVEGSCENFTGNISRARRLSARDCRNEIGIELRWFELYRSALGANGSVEGEYFATLLRSKSDAIAATAETFHLKHFEALRPASFRFGQHRPAAELRLRFAKKKSTGAPALELAIPLERGNATDGLAP